MLPPIDPLTGLLPTSPDGGPHPSTIAEVREVFVDRAPNRDRRELIFEGFMLYSKLIWTYWPNARLWLNGGFVTYKTLAPHDLDVLFLAPMADLDRVFRAEPDALSLLTLQGVTAAEPPLSAPRLQPLGGLIDSFFVPEDVPAAVATWQDRWSMAPTLDGTSYRTDISKGYVEVKQ